MEKQKITVCWLSAGVSSFIAGWLKQDYINEYIYIDIADQHPDSMRFINDCQRVLKRPVIIMSSDEYRSVSDCVKVAGGFRNGRNLFYPCTNWLKKRVRKVWEEAHKDYDITYVWGFDVDEQDRAVRLVEAMPQFEHCFPLIDELLDKQACHGICKALGVKRPEMYDLGYSNNNCVGCVKGGIGYWNKIRVDFPEVFAERSKLEREICNTILHDDKGPIWLDELDPDRGRMQDEIMDDCGIFCELTLKERSIKSELE